MNKKPILFAHLALVAVALIYGGNYIVAREVMVGGFIEPNAFILLRVLCGTALFFIFHRGRIKFTPKEHGRLILCGLTGIAVNQLFFFNGLKLTGPIQSSLIMITTPVLVYLLSMVLLKSQLNWRRSFGVVLGLSGAAMIIYQKQASVSFENAFLGNIFVFINATSYAFYLILAKPLMAKYPAEQVLKYVFLYGLLFVAPVSIRSLMEVPFSTFDTITWWRIGYVVFLTTYLAYRLNGFALGRVSPTLVSMYLYLQPLVASILSIVLGIEFLTYNKLLAACFILLGIAFVSMEGLENKRLRRAK